MNELSQDMYWTTIPTIQMAWNGLKVDSYLLQRLRLLLCGTEITEKKESHVLF